MSRPKIETSKSPDGSSGDAASHSPASEEWRKLRGTTVWRPRWERIDDRSPVGRWRRRLLSAHHLDKWRLLLHPQGAQRPGGCEAVRSQRSQVLCRPGAAPLEPRRRVARVCVSAEALGQVGSTSRGRRARSCALEKDVTWMRV